MTESPESRRAGRRIRSIWAGRALCLGLVCGLAGSLISWGIGHHANQVVFEAAGIVVLACAVMLLNWKLND
jgi:hypothetical protein